MIWLLAGALIPSFLVSWLMAFVVRRRAAQWGLMDELDERKVHTQVTPLGGGLAIWLGVVLPLVVGVGLVQLLMAARDGAFAWPALAQLPLPEIVERHLAGLATASGGLALGLGCATVMMLLGLADDLWELDWRLRLAVEFAVAMVVVAWGWRLSLFNDSLWLTAPVTVFWIVGLVNTFNMLDNMDGLSGGTAAIAAAMLAAVLLVAPDPTTHGPQLFVAGLLLALVGSSCGFLWHNRPPARLFMGDAGAYFIGFLLACCTILATFSGGSLPHHAILAPLCALAVPLYDTASVVWIRLRQGRSPFHADKNHFSHRLVELGMSKPQAVLTIYLATATTGLGALLLHQVDRRGAAVLLLLVLCVLALVAVLEAAARRGNHK